MKTEGSDVTGVVKQDHLKFVTEQLAKEGITDWEGRLPGADELFCDLDSKEALAVFVVQYELLREIEQVTLISLTTSRSGNFHAIVKLANPINDELRAMYQTMLGSDQKRELLHIKSIRAGEANPIILVMRKVKS